MNDDHPLYVTDAVNAADEVFLIAMLDGVPPPVPKGKGGTTSALDRNSAGSIVMVKTLDEILRASKRRVKVGCSAHTW